MAALRRRLSPVRQMEDRFLFAVVMLVASIVVYAIADDSVAGMLAVVTVQAATLIVILRASHAGSGAIIAAWILGIAAVVSVIVASRLGGKPEAAGAAVVGAVLAVVGPPVIVRRVARQSEISVMTVAAALCLYLLAGLFFAYVYGAIDGIAGPFFAQPGPADAVDFVYFSFVTLSTLGYGDLTARLDLGRMLAISEALLGQLYLVSVVALLVANIGRERLRADRG